MEDESFEGVDDYISLSLGFSMKRNAWAGSGHWKYQKVKGKNVMAFACNHESYLFSFRLFVYRRIDLSITVQIQREYPRKMNYPVKRITRKQIQKLTF